MYIVNDPSSTNINKYFEIDYVGIMVSKVLVGIYENMEKSLRAAGVIAGYDLILKALESELFFFSFNRNNNAAIY